MRSLRFAWLSGLFAVWLLGCGTPCETTAQCGDEGMCVAARCQPLACDKTLFAIDPARGACVPLSGCFLTVEQRGWQTCSDDPCQGRAEASCLDDARCQPVYANPSVELQPALQRQEDSPGIPFCLGRAPDVVPVEDEPGRLTAPGVNNGDAPKHRQMFNSGCGIQNDHARAFVACRAVPTISEQKRCEQLTTTECQLRRDCATPQSLTSGRTVPVGPSIPAGGRGENGSPVPNLDPDLGQCFTRQRPPTTTCVEADATTCLISPACQPVGSRCYCPAGVDCDCSGGGFLACETNDHLRRCSSSVDCSADERCDNEEACSLPRTFASPPRSDAQPGSPDCVGSCVKKGCAGFGERMCNNSAACDGGSYGTVCRPRPYCAQGDRVLDQSATGGSCGCDAEFIGCGEQKPLSDLRSERSLLIRDPEILDDPAFALDAVFGTLAPRGQVDVFARSFLLQIGDRVGLANGATTAQRLGFAAFLSELRATSQVNGLAARLALQLHATSLVNRVDLAKPGDCGEARLTYALTKAYTNGNQRMTMIIELRVPDDGNSCRTVAQRWAELSLIDSLAERRSRLIALYAELLKPMNVAQVRTNEFLNLTGTEPWELREFHLDTDGMLKLAPVAQTVDTRWLTSSRFWSWLRDNESAIRSGNAVIPSQYLAAASREDGGRLRLENPTLLAAEKELNAQSCAGCHLTETQSPFVHVGERLGVKRPGQPGYQPGGRAVIDSFLQKELVTRALNLRALLSGSPQSLQASTRTHRARVH